MFYSQSRGKVCEFMLCSAPRVEGRCVSSCCVLLPESGKVCEFMLCSAPRVEGRCVSSCCVLLPESREGV